MLLCYACTISARVVSMSGFVGNSALYGKRCRRKTQTVSLHNSNELSGESTAKPLIRMIRGSLQSTQLCSTTRSISKRKLVLRKQNMFRHDRFVKDIMLSWLPARTRKLCFVHSILSPPFRNAENVTDVCNFQGCLLRVLSPVRFVNPEQCRRIDPEFIEWVKMFRYSEGFR